MCHRKMAKSIGMWPELGRPRNQGREDGQAAVMLEELCAIGVELRVERLLYGGNIDGCIVGAQMISVNEDRTERYQRQF